MSVRERQRRDPKPADKRRPSPEDGLRTRLKWFGWVVWEYVKMFTIGGGAAVLSVFAVTASRPLLVPRFMPEPSFGWLLIGWAILSFWLFIMWGRARMARIGIEAR